ncbi:hypothetical protein O181_090095 [Austropuccinia psidii MF-1]|uniref:Autophagy-related protein n=1 Tax=Austropuccinia psidii MF-1 TaxID=1389203 RepID=A0A9Q3IUG3_9BASI|nr:hypothetical protein [Austropuccinia psidii MF-1]
MRQLNQSEEQEEEEGFKNSTQVLSSLNSFFKFKKISNSTNSYDQLNSIIEQEDQNQNQNRNQNQNQNQNQNFSNSINSSSNFSNFSNFSNLNQIKSVHLEKFKKFSLGFYSYSFASEAFAIVSTTLFLPITLEQFSRDHGFQFPSHQSACSNLPQSICQINLLGKWIDTASFPLYVFSCSVALQAFIVISMGDAADNIIIRKFLLISFASIGSLAAITFFFIQPTSSLWWFSALFAIISNATLGASLVCLNSYIPTLAKTRPSVLKAQHFTINFQQDQNYKSLLSTTIANISARGIAFGYTSGIFALCMSLFLVNSNNTKIDSLRWVVGASGLWWAIFTIPAAFWLPPFKLLDLEQLSNPFQPIKSCRRMIGMLKEYNRLKNTIQFLMAWFLLSDGFSTMTSTAILFAKTVLNMPSSHLVLIGVIAPATGIFGALIAPIIQSKISFCSGPGGNLRMFKLLIGFTCLIPLYVTLGLLFRSSVMSTEWEMYILSSLFGLAYGAFQSYARSVYAELIPPGQEAKWYALYSITDKSSSFFGPFIVGLIADHTHNLRFGFIFILCTLLLSFPILNHVDLIVGKTNAEEYSATQYTAP